MAAKGVGGALCLLLPLHKANNTFSHKANDTFLKKANLSIWSKSKISIDWLMCIAMGPTKDGDHPAQCSVFFERIIIMVFDFSLDRLRGKLKLFAHAAKAGNLILALLYVFYF